MHYLVDFDDSFTFNLKQYLLSLGVKTEVIHWSNISNYMNDNVDTITLGPGPGHPREYDSLSLVIKNILKKKKIRLLGICLGHQIILNTLGFKLKNLEMPIHGQSRVIYLNSFFKEYFCTNKVVGQFYNSLVVCSPKKSSSENQNHHLQNLNENVMIFKSERILSMQFHPESIGSSNLSNGVKKFLK